MKWTTSAPANLALIKYMGKIGSGKPTNPSLSFTLDHCRTKVELDYSSDRKQNVWEPLIDPDFPFVPDLTPVQKERFLNHISFLCQYAMDGEHTPYFTVRSANNFPSDCGLASSASSFAALTHCTLMALADLFAPDALLSLDTMPLLSAKGSGSSCRSFMGPFVMWEGDHVSPINFPYDDLIHMAVIICQAQKKVSSSAAHQRVLTSPLFSTRADRAKNGLRDLINALNAQNWQDAFHLVWGDFWDMHCLFETSNPAFGYFTPQSIEILMKVREIWEMHGDGPLATMDAGPNVHLLWRPDQVEFAQTVFTDLRTKFQVLASPHIRVT
ncbi:MAG: diphosphomevalonate decarboxylase [Alphaproteobacteria bacterium]|nr:diphosphomevalonate decarboxylase [Alphaproteobacteria bacterium]